MPLQVPADRTTEQLARDLDASRRRLYKLVRAADQKALNKRPPSGAWSALENVRHLLFAEQLHFSVVLKSTVEWSPLGMTGMRSQRFAAVGTAKAPKLEEVLSAWDAFRAANRKALKGRDDDALRKTLYGNTRHIRIHADVIERLLRQRG